VTLIDPLDHVDAAEGSPRTSNTVLVYSEAKFRTIDCVSRKQVG
jgi:hypothetical protein